MKRHFPGLHAEASRGDGILEGVFLVRVDRAYYRWHPQKPFFILSFAILEPSHLTSRKVSGRMDLMSAANNLFAICSKTVGAIRLLPEFDNSIQCDSP
jgi:hypothetical protein